MYVYRDCLTMKLNYINGTLFVNCSYTRLLIQKSFYSCICFKDEIPEKYWPKGIINLALQRHIYV